LVLFGAFWVGMVAVGAVGFTKGDPRILVFGTDYRGDVCGMENDGGNGTAGMDMTDYPAMYWPNPAQIFDASKVKQFKNPFQGSKTFCVKECPFVEKTAALQWVCNYPDGYGPGADGADGHLTGAGCGDAGCVKWGLPEWQMNSMDYFDLLTPEQQADSLKLKGPCYPLLVDTVNTYGVCQITATVDHQSEAYKEWIGMGGREVVPQGSSVEAVAEEIADNLDTPAKIFMRYVNDVQKSWYLVMLCGLVLPMLLSAVWMVMLRYLAGVVVWVSVVVVNLALIALTIILWMKAGYIGEGHLSALAKYAGQEYTVDLPAYTDPSEGSKENMTGLAIASSVATAVVFLVTLVSMRAVRTAINVLKVGVQSMAAAPMSVLFPLGLPFISMYVLVVYWLLAAVYIFSAGTVAQYDCDVDTTFVGLGGNPACAADERCQCDYGIHFDKGLGAMLGFHFFGLLWTSQFIIAITLTTLAGAFAPFYWTRGVAGEVKAPVSSSLKRTLRYSLGSLAFGSFIMAVIQFVRAVVKYMEHKMKALKEKNIIISYVMYCVNCFLWCLQKIVQFINRHAYVVIAIEGISYCQAAGKGISIMGGNLMRVAAVNVIGDSFLFLGKIAVAALCTLVSVEVFGMSDLELSSPFMPTVLVFILSLFVASLFFSVAEMAIDTVLMSYCIDCNNNGGQALSAPPLLQSTLQHHHITGEKPPSPQEAQAQPPSGTQA
jgi:choline transporter-like protein 2/4/5